MVAGIPGATSAVAWSSFVKDPDGQLERFRKQPEIQKQINAFKEAWGKLATEKKPAKAMFENRAIANVVLTAFQLEGDINYVGRNEKIVSQKLNDQNSLVNRLIDGRYRQLAYTLDYASRGNAIFSSPRTINDIVDKFVVNQFEKSLGQSNPGLREAAYFARNAKNVTNVYQLLGDPVLRSVVVGGLQLPGQVGLLDVDKQAQLISSRLNIDKLSKKDGGDSLNTILNNITEAKAQRYALAPAHAAAVNGANAVSTLSKKLDDIQKEFTRLDGLTNPTGSNAAQITFQQGQIGNYVQADGLLGSAETAITDIDSSLSRIKVLYQQTVGLNPVGDAALIAQNKEEYTALVNKVQATINGATFVDPSSATTRSLLLAIPGPGTTSVNYQTGPTATTQTINGYDLQGFVTSLQSAAADFNAGNYTNASATVSTAQGSYFTAKNGIKADRNTYETKIDSIGRFVVSLNVTDLKRGVSSVNDGLSRTSTVLNQLGQLKNLATSLSSGTLTPAERTTQSATFFATQASLNTTLTIAPPGIDNLLTTAGFNYTLFGANSIAAPGNNFTAVTYDGVRTPPAGPDVTIADANNFLSALQTSAIVDDVNKLRTGLKGAKQGLESALNDFDPYAEVRSQLSALSASLPEIKQDADANDGKDNILKRGESPLTVFLPNGGKYTVNIFEDYDNDVEALLTAAADQYLADPVLARSTLATAQQNLGNYRSKTASQARPIEYDYNRYNDKINTLEAQLGKDNTSGPYDSANKFVLQFIQRYLATSQTQNQSASNAYQLLLLPQAKGGGINLSSLV